MGFFFVQIRKKLILRILIKSVKIIEKGSPINGEVLDILINKGLIEQIEQTIDIEADTVVNIPNLCVSIGWCDMRVHGRNPGYEQKESFDSLENAAIEAQPACLHTLQSALHLCLLSKPRWQMLHQ